MEKETMKKIDEYAHIDEYFQIKRKSLEFGKFRTWVVTIDKETLEATWAVGLFFYDSNKYMYAVIGGELFADTDAIDEMNTMRPSTTLEVSHFIKRITRIYGGELRSDCMDFCRTELDYGAYYKLLDICRLNDEYVAVYDVTIE